MKIMKTIIGVLFGVILSIGLWFGGHKTGYEQGYNQGYEQAVADERQTAREWFEDALSDARDMDAKYGDFKVYTYELNGEQIEFIISIWNN